MCIVFDGLTSADVKLNVQSLYSKNTIIHYRIFYG